MELNEISVQLQAGKVKDVRALVQQALDEGFPADRILNEGLLSGMDAIGVKFRDNEVFVPDVLIAARAMKAGQDPEALSGRRQCVLRGQGVHRDRLRRSP